MQYEHVRLECNRCVATVTLNRPETRNALDAATVGEVSACLRTVASSADVRALRLESTGSCFGSGADIRTMRGMGTAPYESNLADARAFTEMLHLLHELPKPTVACVQGPAVGGSVGLVACCDLAIGSEKASFRLSEVHLGVVGAMISPYLVEAIGARMTKRLMLTGERFDARQAARWGLLDEVVPAEELGEAVQTVITQLLRGAPGAQATSKELVREVARSPLDAGMRERTASVIAAARTAPEGRAGLKAFLDKARPPWALRDPKGACDR